MIKLINNTFRKNILIFALLLLCLIATPVLSISEDNSPNTSEKNYETSLYSNETNKANPSTICLSRNDIENRLSLKNRYSLLPIDENQNWAYISDNENILSNHLVVRVLSNGKLSDYIMMRPDSPFGNSELEYTLEYPEGTGSIIPRKWGEVIDGEWDCCPVVNGQYYEC